VLSSVQLDCESTFDAVEVDDVRRNGMLPPKAKAQLTHSQSGPQQAFGVGHVPAQCSRIPAQ
jgi:hypothetical protein